MVVGVFLNKTVKVIGPFYLVFTEKFSKRFRTGACRA